MRNKDTDVIKLPSEDNRYKVRVSPINMGSLLEIDDSRANTAIDQFSSLKADVLFAPGLLLATSLKFADLKTCSPLMALLEVLCKLEGRADHIIVQLSEEQAFLKTALFKLGFTESIEATPFKDTKFFIQLKAERKTVYDKIYSSN